MSGAPFLDDDETELTGRPSAPGLYSYVLRATADNNPANFVERVFTLRVVPMQVVWPRGERSTNPILPAGQVGAPYSTAIKVAGGTSPVHVLVVSVQRHAAGPHVERDGRAFRDADGGGVVPLRGRSH